MLNKNFRAKFKHIFVVDWEMCYFSPIMGSSKQSLIKRVQTELPRGVPFDLDVLERLGVSAKLAAYYAESGWLIRLGQGVYAFPSEELNAHGAVKLLQDRVAGLHVAARSALALQGVRHNLAPREQLVLWGDVRFTLPSLLAALSQRTNLAARPRSDGRVS